MSKTQLLIVILVGITLAFAFFIMWALRHGSPPSATPTVPILPTATSSPWVTNKITIGGVEMNNFFLFGAQRGSVVLIVNNPRYQILYMKSGNTFLISILDIGFDEARAIAERMFLASLGITKEQACALNVSINTPDYINPDLAGTNYRLSFCQ